MTFTDPDLAPEIPYPFPPLREPPRRTEPISIPLVEMPPTDPVRQLFDRRTVVVSGRLDGACVSHMCAQLMALDGSSADAVELLVNSAGGPLGEIAALLDVFDLMRADVNSTCIGTAVGTAAVIVACATGTRRAGRNARISLRLESGDLGQGTAEESARPIAEHAAELHRVATKLASVTGQPVDDITRELESGGFHDASSAQAIGLIDGVVERL